MDSAAKDVEVLADVPRDGDVLPPTKPASNAVSRFGEKIFQVHTRGSTWLGEFRAGCVLFMTSAYILFLNPLILSGGGLPRKDIVLATAISTAIATFVMGGVANYPWVVSVQLGTNSLFVNTLGTATCGANAKMVGPDQTCGLPCTCVPVSSTNSTLIPDVVANGQCAADTPNTCIGTKIPYQMLLAATFLEGVIFLAICLSGLRSVFLQIFPKSVLFAGAAGIGVFISFVGMKGCGFIVQTPFPTLLGLNIAWPYAADSGGYGQAGYDSGIGFNSCVMYFNGPPYGPICPWLALGGLIFTALLMVWNIQGAFIAGIFFTMFISWIIFPEKMSQGGLVPDKVVDVASFDQTAGALEFNWGPYSGTVAGAMIMFLYLDFIGSCITFVSLGQMAGVLNKNGMMPRANLAFMADGFGSMIGGLLGTSALTTYVESASAMREGGKTGFTAIVCGCFFLLSIVLWPLFSAIPEIATSPILCLIGVVIFMESICELDWTDATEAIPAFATIIVMPFTNNIAYGIVAGLGFYLILKFATYKLFAAQKKWPGYALYSRWEADAKRSMFTRIPGWNVNELGERDDNLVAEESHDWSLLDLAKKSFADKAKAKDAALSA